MIYVDKEGTWFHKGAPIIHRGFLLLFYKLIHLDQDGRYIIKFNEQTCVLDVEDTPFVILRTTFVQGATEEHSDRFVLDLIDETQEVLDPATLTVAADHVMYCKVRDGQFDARFSRPSYYQLAQHIQQDPVSDRFFLPLNGATYYIGQKGAGENGCQPE